MMDIKVLPTRECRFRTFLLQIAEDDLDWIGYLQRFFGSYLLGNQPKHKIHVFLGAGANGKTVLTEAVRNVLNESEEGVEILKYHTLDKLTIDWIEKIKYM
jgi:phage/plasmid-associated DNA primase